ncbi:MAG: hypothetical protein NC093_09840 [Alistipes sp.]|nr:hypothetical protein [Alistipes sp.]
MKNNDKFEYTYSASQQSELDAIRKKYLPQEENKMDRLRRLDKSVSNKSTMISIIIGVIGTLVMGLGMCCVMEWSMFAAGIIIGVAGMVIIALAYPIFSYITKKQREKIAPEILRLTEEISKENIS